MSTYHTIVIDDLNIEVRSRSIITIDTETFEVTVPVEDRKTKTWKLENVDQLIQLKENCDDLLIDIVWEI